MYTQKNKNSPSSAGNHNNIHNEHNESKNTDGTRLDHKKYYEVIQHTQFKH